MKSKKHIDRKTAIEHTLKQAEKLSADTVACQQAWLRLCRELEFMQEPEAAMPRFKGLLRAIWTASTNES